LALRKDKQDVDARAKRGYGDKGFRFFRMLRNAPLCY
jgi:hypothetical protein